MYVVTVDYILHPGTKENFIPTVRKNARESLANEPQCILFDICSDSSDDTRVFLYEIYTHLSAFQDHLASAHFRQFSQAVVDMVASKTVKTFDEISPASR